MYNADLLSQADRILRPVLKELARFPWVRVTGCCAGHKAEDNLWMEYQVLGASGLHGLMPLLKIFDGKLVGTDCRADCLLNYTAASEVPVPHGWIPFAVEVFWPPKNDWRRSQSLVVEAFLSSVEEFSERAGDEAPGPAAINYCPFCSSSFIRLDRIDPSGTHRYRCYDCDVTWTMVDPGL